MHNPMRRRISAALIIPLTVVTIIVGIARTSTADTPYHAPHLIEGKPTAFLRYDPEVSNLRVPPPHAFSQTSPQSRASSPTVSVNFIPQGNTDASGTACQAWPPEAKSALNYATSIWASLIKTPVSIVIDACWADLGGSILGYGGANNYYVSAGTLYPIALANAMSGYDLNGSDVEINVTYNRNFDWYWPTDGNTPSHQIDFVSVVLHEVCHGLGFGGSMAIYGGLGYWGFGTVPQPAVYDRYTENGVNQALIDFPNGSSTLAAQLTSNNLFFDGPNARAANGGAPAKLFAPSSWLPGSSYAHLDEMFDGTPNALMTYSLGRGESLHSPGPVTLGILQDSGWNFADEPPDISLSMALRDGPDLGPGDSVEFTISIANIGVGPTAGVTITDVLSTDVMTSTWTASASLGGAFLKAGPPYVWGLEGLAAGASGTITVSGTLNPALPTDFAIVNVASASSVEQEERMDNNSVTLIIGGNRVYLPTAIK